MPIVFEEVTGEIAPEREASQPEAAAPSGGGDETAETVRRVIALMLEREHRLRVD